MTISTLIVDKKADFSKKKNVENYGQIKQFKSMTAQIKKNMITIILLLLSSSSLLLLSSSRLLLTLLMLPSFLLCQSTQHPYQRVAYNFF